MKGGFVLSTGRFVESFDHRLSTDDENTLTYGSDGHITLDGSLEEFGGQSAYTHKERLEIAEYMIRRWLAFVAAAAATETPAP